MPATYETLQSLRFPLLLGALAGALIGALASQPLRAAAPEVEVASPSCSMLCPSTTWLRAPIRHRTTG